MAHFENEFLQKNYIIAKFVLDHEGEEERIKEVKDKFKASIDLYKKEITTVLDKMYKEAKEAQAEKAKFDYIEKLRKDVKELTAELLIGAIDTAIEEYNEEKKDKSTISTNNTDEESWR